MTSECPLTQNDTDPIETNEWLDALQAVEQVQGRERAQFLLGKVREHARRMGVTTKGLPYSSYRNPIPVGRQPAFPDDAELEERIISIIR